MKTRRTGILFGLLLIVTAAAAITLTAPPALGAVALCGDGTVEPPETCDPPGVPMPPNGNLCRADCTFCGDGIPNGSAPHEICDDGNANNQDACSNVCVPVLCGGGNCGGGADCGFEVTNARVLIDTACPCRSDLPRAHYTRCAGFQLLAALRTGLLSYQCRGALRAYYLRSTCGRNPKQTWVPCVRTGPGGKVTCTIRTAARCTGKAMVACPGFTHCLDAADTDGDGTVGVGDSGDCGP